MATISDLKGILTIKFLNSENVIYDKKTSTIKIMPKLTKEKIMASNKRKYEKLEKSN